MAIGKTAFLFPGQGSQTVGMLKDWIESEAVVRETFAEAAEALGYDLAGLVANGPAEDLNSTERTQPALLTASVALWRAWQKRGGRTPDYLAGHSLGEYSALVVAGALTFSDAVGLVKSRGRAMQSAVPVGQGAMAAIIGLTDGQVREACADAPANEVCAAVNYNAPGQVVIAGTQAGVDAGIASAKALGARRAMPLAVSAPSHCELMQPAAEILAVEMSSTDWRQAEIPVVQNVDARPYTDVEIVRNNLVEQLYRPVLWVDTIQWLAAEGVTDAVECGPGKVLAGLTKRIDKSVSVSGLETPEQMDAAIAAWNR